MERPWRLRLLLAVLVTVLLVWQAARGAYQTAVGRVQFDGASRAFASSASQRERLEAALGELASAMELVERHTPRRADLYFVVPLSAQALEARRQLAAWLYPRAVHLFPVLPGQPANMRASLRSGAFALVAEGAPPYPYGELGALLGEVPGHRLYRIGGDLPR